MSYTLKSVKKGCSKINDFPICSIPTHTLTLMSALVLSVTSMRNSGDFFPSPLFNNSFNMSDHWLKKKGSLSIFRSTNVLTYTTSFPTPSSKVSDFL